MTFVHHTHSYPICGIVCVCHLLIAKGNLSPVYFFPSSVFPFNRGGAANISGLRCRTKTVQICCGIERGRLLYVLACTDATKKLQGLDLSSAKKQIGTCDDLRRTASFQGAMQVCVCVCDGCVVDVVAASPSSKELTLPGADHR